MSKFSAGVCVGGGVGRGREGGELLLVFVSSAYCRTGFLEGCVLVR